jgi:S1-C subfamily serine protease
MAEPRQTWRLPLTAIAGFLLGVVFSVGGNELGLTRTAPPQASATAEPADPAAGDPVLPISQDRPSTASRSNPVVEVAARAAPAVVSIGCEVPTQSPFQIFYSGRSTSTSQGSGAVIRADGVVLTNAHVVEGATRITATLPDETSYEATVVGLDSELDLAVLQLEGAQGLPTIPLGSSSDLLLGETVIAIGNPFGLGHTLTTGVVSSRSRTLEVGERVFQDYVQTDAGINPGNSGGPLLNIHGELIGINTAIRRDAENIGFAIPVPAPPSPRAPCWWSASTLAAAREPPACCRTTSSFASTTAASTRGPISTCASPPSSPARPCASRVYARASPSSSPSPPPPARRGSARS